MKLIVGLGNPGNKYAQTRHNVGFMALEAIAEQFNFPEFSEHKKTKSLISQSEINGKKTLLLKPQTFMNESGEAVRAAVDFFDITQGNIIVIHDDADTPIGKIRETFGGEGAGHNGIASINAHLKQEYNRIKVGVSNEYRTPGQAIDFVLKKFNLQDLKILEDERVFEKVIEKIF